MGLLGSGPRSQTLGETEPGFKGETPSAKGLAVLLCPPPVSPSGRSTAENSNTKGNLTEEKEHEQHRRRNVLFVRPPSILINPIDWSRSRISESAGRLSGHPLKPLAITLGRKAAAYQWWIRVASSGSRPRTLNRCPQRRLQ